MGNSLTNKKSQINSFVEHVQQGINAWVKAGEIVANMIDDDPGCIDEICEACPSLTPEIVLNFEQLGRKTLHPRLLIADGPGVRRLRKLPYEIQEKYLSEPVELLVSKGETIQCDVMNLSPLQAAQVFGPAGVRSVAAQRAFLEDQAVKIAAPIVPSLVPYRVKGGKLEILNPCTLTRKDIAKLLVELE